MTKTSGAGSAKLICIEYGPDASILATTTVDEHTATTVWDDLEGTVTLNASTVAYSLAVELNAVEGNAGFTGMRAAPPKSTFLT